MRTVLSNSSVRSSDPLYAIVSTGPRDEVSSFLRFIGSPVERERHSLCAADSREESRAPRVDAQVSDERAGVGGWLPVLQAGGRPHTQKAHHASRRKSHPRRVFAREGKASRVIALLVPLAMLLTVRAFFPPLHHGQRTRLCIAPSIKDSRGNGALLTRL